MMDVQRPEPPVKRDEESEVESLREQVRLLEQEVVRLKRLLEQTRQEFSRLRQEG